MERTLEDRGLFFDGFSLARLLESNLLEKENEFPGSPFFKMRGDIDQLLIKETALCRGMEVKFYRPDIYRVSDREKSVLFCQTSAGISEVYRFCAQMKSVTKELLSRNDVPVPPGESFTDYRKAVRYFKAVSWPVVIKPVLGSHGRGITTGVEEKGDFDKAWDIAKEKSSEIIVERHIAGCDIRVNVIGGRAVAACLRIPANVVGDGHSTIGELVAEKNKRRRRNPAHLLMSEYIKRLDLLERSGISVDAVPAEGERVWLSSVANVSVGGEGVQLVEHLDPRILRVAERVARAFPRVHHVGVDVVVPEYSRPQDCKPYVIEVNTNSAISAPVFPNYGKAVDLPGLLLDYLFDDPASGRCMPEAPGPDGTSGGPLTIASPWDYERYDTKSRKRLSGQKTLIGMAANRLNLKCSEVGSSVLAVEAGNGSTLFHRAMPDIVPQVARRACTHSDLRGDLLEKEGLISSLGGTGESAFPEQKIPGRYRLLVINGGVVAGLERLGGGGDWPGDTPPANRLFGELTRDVSEQVHEEFAGIAVKAVAAVFNPFVAGVDIIARDISRPASGQSWLINDIVCNPALGWHYFPAYGKGRDVACKLLTSLFPQLNDATVELLHLKITVQGKVRGIGYRKWVQGICHRKGILGKVRNVSPKTVEIMAQGSPVALSSFVSQCSSGPRAASDFDVRVDSLPVASYEKFEIV